MTDMEKIQKLREKDNFSPRPVAKKQKRSCPGCSVRRPRSR